MTEKANFLNFYLLYNFGGAFLYTNGSIKSQPDIHILKYTEAFYKDNVFFVDTENSKMLEFSDSS